MSGEVPQSPHGSVKDLSDIISMKNLQVICVFGQPLSDITPLAECARLEDVFFMHCLITDASPLTALNRDDVRVIIIND